MGKIISIGEHVYRPPDAPTSSIILPGFHGIEHKLGLDDLVVNRYEKKENCIWQRLGPKNLPIEQDPWPKIWDDFIPGHTKLFHETTKYNGKTGFLDSLSEEDTRWISFLFTRELYRRNVGLHIKVGDEIQYWPEDYYNMLQWVKLKGAIDPQGNRIDYGTHRRFQMELGYLLKDFKNDRKCMGGFFSKAKKTGVTQFFASYYINKSTMTKDQFMGMVSYDFDTATVPTNMGYYYHGLDNYPNIFKPMVALRSKDRIEFGINNSGTTGHVKAALRKILEQRPLNTTVYAATTKIRCFDAPVMNDMWFDELAKYPKGVPVDQVWDQNKEAIKIQDIINGKAWVTFYPPENDTENFFHARKLYFDSKIKTRNQITGLTRSGLKCFHIPAINSYTSCFDQYGECDVKKATQINQAEEDAVKHNKRSLQAHNRQYGKDERAAWGSGGVGSTFDNIRLGQRDAELQEMMASKRLFNDGRLVWSNPLWEVGRKDKRPRGEFTYVKFMPLTKEEIEGGMEGRIRDYYQLPPNYYNLPLAQGRDEQGNLLPPPVFLTCGGTDPTDFAAESEVIQGSKNGGFTLLLPNVHEIGQYGLRTAKKIVSEYFDRPDNPEEFYQDVVKEIIYYGKLVIIEANKAWVATRLIAEGLGHYMIVKDEHGAWVRWSPSMYKIGNDGKLRATYRLIRTEKEELEAIVMAISHVIAPPAKDEIDFLAEIDSERLISQCMDFTKERSKFADLVMSYGYGLLAYEVATSMPGTDQNGQYRENLAVLLRAFSGM
jgi:hypothetical protein